jgi:hypothetical protein
MKSFSSLLMIAAILLLAQAANRASAQELPVGMPTAPRSVSVTPPDRLAAAPLTGRSESIGLAAQAQGTTQLLTNGDFENSAWPPWQTSGAPTLDTTVKHGGTRAAHLGNADNANDQVLQTISIPANASAVTLDFWYRLSTNETDPNCDYFLLGLWDQAGTTNYALLSADIGQGGSTDWAHMTYTLSAAQLNNVVGKTVTFAMLVQTDASLSSRAWADDVAVNVTTFAGGSGYRIFIPLIARSQGQPPVINSFSAIPASITPGGSSTLSWNVAGATSLSITPGIGMVTGSSKQVSPAATTEYTLVATNAYGSTSAKTIVTVGSTTTSGSFFIVPAPEIDRPTSHPTIGVDANGGVHVAFTPDSATTQDPTRPAYYAYCSANCTSASAFSRVSLGDHVEYANLSLNAAGQPRLLLRLRAGSMFAYQYWACDGNCTSTAQWISGTVAYAYARPSASGEPFSRFFALDAAGQPRLVYYDEGENLDDPHRGVYYTGCDSNCTSAANWAELQLLQDSDAQQFDLALSATGQARMAYVSYDEDNLDWYVAYAECHTGCFTLANWSTTRLVDTVSASVTEFATFSLRVDSTGHPRLALYTGTGLGGTLTPNTLYYLWCDAASCTGNQMWQALDLNLPDYNGEDGVSLALDNQDRPRIAYHAGLTTGDGLYYTHCNANCGASAQNWQSGRVEPSAKVNTELPISPYPGCPFPQCNPPVPPCTYSFWETGVRPALALDAAGNPRIAYDADHHGAASRCTSTDTRLTRFALFNQP